VPCLPVVVTQRQGEPDGDDAEQPAPDPHRVDPEREVAGEFKRRFVGVGAGEMGGTEQPGAANAALHDQDP
jgi:hypothetical protein